MFVFVLFLDTPPVQVLRYTVHLIYPRFPHLHPTEINITFFWTGWSKQTRENYTNRWDRMILHGTLYMYALLIMKFSQVPSFLSTFQIAHLTMKNHVSCARCLHGFFFVDDDDSFCNIMKNTKRN